MKDLPLARIACLRGGGPDARTSAALPGRRAFPSGGAGLGPPSRAGDDARPPRSRRAFAPRTRPAVGGRPGRWAASPRPTAATARLPRGRLTTRGAEVVEKAGRGSSGVECSREGQSRSAHSPTSATGPDSARSTALGSPAIPDARGESKIALTPELFMTFPTRICRNHRSRFVTEERDSCTQLNRGLRFVHE